MQKPQGVDGNEETLLLSIFSGIEAKFRPQKGCWNRLKIRGWRKWKDLDIRSNPMLVRIWTDLLQTLVLQTNSTQHGWIQTPI